MFEDDDACDMQKTRVRVDKNATGVEPGITGLNPNVKRKGQKKKEKKIDQYINEMSGKEAGGLKSNGR